MRQFKPQLVTLQNGYNQKKKKMAMPNVPEDGDKGNWQKLKVIQPFWKGQTTSYKNKAHNHLATQERTPVCSPLNRDSTYSQREVSQSARRSFIHNSKELETALVPVNQRMDKQDNIFGQGLLFSNKTESSIDTATWANLRNSLSNESSQTQKVHAI